MKPKDRRSKLFQDRKPEFRVGTDEDLGWAYVSHRLGGGDLDKEKFKGVLKTVLSAAQVVFVVQDRHSRFDGEFGPVGMIAIRWDGWRVEPEFLWFEWASARNKLRSTVAFFISQVRYSKAVGIGEWRVPENQAKLTKKLKRYMPLYPVGRVPNSSATGTEYLFFMTGAKRKWDSSTASATSSPTLAPIQ